MCNGPIGRRLMGSSYPMKQRGKAMFYKLNQGILLRGWQKIPYALVDKNNCRTHFIKAEEMTALQLCNGKIDLSLPMIPDSVREMLPTLEKNGVIVPCAKGDAVAPEQEYYCYPARYIRAAHWSVTGRCNYRCKHCYMSAPDAKYGELSHEAVMSIARQLIACGIQEVSLTGGEPLLRKDFLELVDLLTEGGIKITTIYSNGKLVTDRLLDELDKRGLHPCFNMSYDGVEGWHDWLRGVKGATEDVEAAFRRCRDRGFPTGAEMCLHQGNKHLLRQTVNRLASLGCGSLKPIPISNVGAWKEGGYGESITIQELYQTFLDYIPQYYADGMPMAIQLSGLFLADPKEPEVYSIPMKKSCKDPANALVCGHARNVMYISAEGRTLPCMALSGMDIQERFPLITEVGLAECLSESTYMKLLETRASEVIAHNPQCRTCRHAGDCLGGCRAAALETTPEDLMGRDMCACELFKGGWVEKIQAVMAPIGPKLA